MIFPDDCRIDKEWMTPMLLRGTQHGMPLALPRCAQHQHWQSCAGKRVPDGAPRWSCLVLGCCRCCLLTATLVPNLPRSCSSCRTVLAWAGAFLAAREGRGEGMEGENGSSQMLRERQVITKPCWHTMHCPCQPLLGRAEGVAAVFFTRILLDLNATKLY